MANRYFSFKQFTIFHDQCAMKVGTDGVLLGAWVKVSGAAKILDVGTGTGLIAMMMAQRSASAAIDAVEIDEKASLQARENVTACPWNNRITIIHDSYQHLAATTSARYDLVTCNPPFFRNALLSPLASRSVARHDTDLSYQDLLHQATAIMTNQGRLAVIVPARESESFMEIAHLQGLYISRLLKIKALPDRPVSRVMMEFSRKRGLPEEEGTLIVRKQDRITYTEEYRELTGNFYLNMI
jgi:tRNA1Val (adenine37-N6)-methyltransferase